MEWMAVRYQAAVGKELRKYGLRYEDLYDPVLEQVIADYSAALSSCNNA